MDLALVTAGSPVASTSHHSMDLDEEDFPDAVIKCPCERRKEVGFMMECEICKCWAHGHCLGIQEDNIPQIYVCPSCKPQVYTFDKSNNVHINFPLAYAYAASFGFKNPPFLASIFPPFDLAKVQASLKRQTPRGRPRKAIHSIFSPSFSGYSKAVAPLASFPKSFTNSPVHPQSPLVPRKLFDDDRNKAPPKEPPPKRPVELTVNFTSETSGEALRAPPAIPQLPAVARSPSPAKAAPTPLVCEHCGALEELSWKSGESGKKLLCFACGKKWEATLVKKPSMFDASDEEDAMDVDQTEGRPFRVDSPGTSVPARPNAMGCEQCGKVEGLGWKIGTAGRRLLCAGCSVEHDSPGPKPSMFDPSDDESAADEEQSATPGSLQDGPALDGVKLSPPAVEEDKSWLKPIEHRPFLQPAAQIPIRAPVAKKPPPQSKHSAMPVQYSREPCVAFLNSLNPGLGVVAPFLHNLGLTNEEDLKRMKPGWWAGFFKEEIQGRGLRPFDEFMLERRVAGYLEGMHRDKPKKDGV